MTMSTFVQPAPKTLAAILSSVGVDDYADAWDEDDADRCNLLMNVGVDIGDERFEVSAASERGEHDDFASISDGALNGMKAVRLAVLALFGEDVADEGYDADDRDDIKAYFDDESTPATSFMEDLECAIEAAARTEFDRYVARLYRIRDLQEAFEADFESGDAFEWESRFLEELHADHFPNVDPRVLFTIASFAQEECDIEGMALTIVESAEKRAAIEREREALRTTVDEVKANAPTRERRRL